MFRAWQSTCNLSNQVVTHRPMHNLCKHSASLPGATEGIATKIPTQTNAAESGLSPDSGKGSSCLSRRNMILGGAAAVVAAISLPKNSLALTPLTTDQPSKTNNGKEENMNSTT